MPSQINSNPGANKPPAPPQPIQPQPPKIKQPPVKDSSGQSGNTITAQSQDVVYGAQQPNGQLTEAIAEQSQVIADQEKSVASLMETARVQNQDIAPIVQQPHYQPSQGVAQPWAYVEQERYNVNPSYVAQPESLADFPALRAWKTSIGLSILGVVLEPVLLMIVVFLVAVLAGLVFPSIPRANLSYASAAVIWVLVVIYALVFYRSYFTKKPILKSSGLISFLNFLLGGVIFGALWNTNLTKSYQQRAPKRGVSYIVCAINGIVMLIELVILMLLTPGVSTQDISLTSAPQANTSATETRAITYHEAGTTITIPAGWFAITPDEGEVFRYCNANDTANFDMFVPEPMSSEEFNSLTSDELVAGIYENYAGAAGQLTDVKAEKITLGAKEYWELSWNYSEGAAQTRCVQTFTEVNGSDRYFELVISPPNNSDAASSYQDFNSMISSAVYE